MDFNTETAIMYKSLYSSKTSKASHCQCYRVAMIDEDSGCGDHGGGCHDCEGGGGGGGGWR